MTEEAFNFDWIIKTNVVELIKVKKYLHGQEER
jgi:hypothetical protein